MAPRLRAIIPAAGPSSRMGKLKAAPPLGTDTIVDRCIDLKYVLEARRYNERSAAEQVRNYFAL